MKQLQTSTAAKIATVLLLLGFTFTGSIFGLKALMTLPYQGTEHYEETGDYSALLQQYEDDLAHLFTEEQDLKTQEMSFAERRQRESAVAQLQDRLKAENTNFRYRIFAQDGTELRSNVQPDEALGTIHYANFRERAHYMINVEYGSQYEEYGVGSRDDLSTSTAPSDELFVTYSAACGVVDENQLAKGAVRDEFYQLCTAYHYGKANFSIWVALCGGLMAGAALCLLYLLWAAGHRAGTEEIVSTWQERIYLEFYLAAMAAVGFAPLFGGFYLGDYLVDGSYHVDFGPYLNGAWWLILAIAALITLFAGLAALVLRTVTVRVKAGTLARTTLLCRVVGWMVRTIHALLCGAPLFWKSAVGYVLFFFANLMLFTQGMYSGFWALMWILLNLAVFLGLCWWTMCFRRLRFGSRAIAAGDLSYHLDTARMPLDLKAHAEDLNNISTGLSSAVDKQMKSERFKAELITNVSHDLKTPLTSIINYVDLLKTTEQTDPKAMEYIEVLDRKSQRLKKLTEDLVEASKASTGVLTVNREKIGLAQLLDQALGEWAEKLESRKLTPMLSLPDGETWVYADGRHLWRVIDNLLANCAKYAMEGTRVYLDLARGKGQVSLSVKNISREPLNVPPERLMERFVRGEESRTTEGSGLGLSIARSLTELQGGTFELAVDGDLFKAIVTLPQAN